MRRVYTQWWRFGIHKILKAKQLWHHSIKKNKIKFTRDASHIFLSSSFSISLQSSSSSLSTTTTATTLIFVFLHSLFPTIKQLLKRIVCIHKNRRMVSVHFFTSSREYPSIFLWIKNDFFSLTKIKKFFYLNHNFFYLTYVKLSSCWWFCGIFKTFTSFAGCLMMGKVFK